MAVRTADTDWIDCHALRGDPQAGWHGRGEHDSDGLILDDDPRLWRPTLRLIEPDGSETLLLSLADTEAKARENAQAAEAAAEAQAQAQAEAKKKAEDKARKEAEAKAAVEAKAKAEKEARAKAAAEAEAKAKAEEAAALAEAEAKAKREAEEKAKAAAVAKAKKEAQEKAKAEAEAKAKAEAERKAKAEAAAKARAEEKAKKEAEAKAKKAAEAKAKREAEAKAKKEAEAKAKREAEAKARKEAEARAKAEAEAKAKEEAEEKAKREAEEKARKAAEEKAAAEAKAKKEAEEKARREAEKKAKEEEKARKEAEKKAAAESKAKAEAKAKKEAEAKAKKEAEAKRKAEEEAKAKKKAEEKAEAEAAALAEMDLGDAFRRLIRENGPISLAQFMGDSNARYYASRDPLGEEGDFITAPEVSQMFGELIGLWFADLWVKMGQSDNIHYVELGPGRGTLTKDVLRAASKYGFNPHLHFVEGSIELRKIQRQEFPSVRFHNDLSTLPEDRPLLIVANEFFDALPVHQLICSAQGWHERMVGLEDDRFVFVAGDKPMDSVVPTSWKSAPQGSMIETSPAAATMMAEIAQRLTNQGGAALIIDYGSMELRAGSTLQALKKHKKVDPLSHPGEADITAHVDFEMLSEVVEKNGADVMGLKMQGDWLLEMGIDTRLEALQRINPGKAKELQRQYNRLVDDGEMGALFKVLGICGRRWPIGAGFD